MALNDKTDQKYRWVFSEFRFLTW